MCVTRTGTRLCIYCIEQIGDPVYKEHMCDEALDAMTPVVDCPRKRAAALTFKHFICAQCKQAYSYPDTKWREWNAEEEEEMQVWLNAGAGQFAPRSGDETPAQ
jgi:hypothetical protein